MSAVLPIPLFKLAICYERAWWEEMPPVDPGIGLMRKVTNGKSVTDLPVRQCIYWKVNPQNGHAVILIYDDGTDLDYWAGLRDSTSTPHLDDPAIMGHECELPKWSSCTAPDRMVQEVHRQLLEMHGVKDPSAVPAPYTAAYRDWGEDPFGGGANFDSQLFLFRAVQTTQGQFAAQGIFANNDLSSSNRGALLTNSANDGSQFVLQQAGLYFIAITNGGVDARNANGGPIWPGLDQPGLRSFGGFQDFQAWGGDPSADVGDYEIRVEGIAGVPAPGALGLLGLAGLVGRRRR
jgi:MYXO-CTERM domain-containing protein